MQWPVTACSKLRVDYNEHQVKLTVSIEAAGVAGAAGKTRKNRKKRNDSESFDCVGGLLARWVDGLVGLGLELGLFGGWYVVVSDICRHILRLSPNIGLTYVAVTCKIVIIPAVATRTSTSAMHCNKLNWNFKEGEIAFDSFVCVCSLTGFLWLICGKEGVLLSPLPYLGTINLHRLYILRVWQSDEPWLVACSCVRLELN